MNPVLRHLFQSLALITALAAASCRPAADTGPSEEEMARDRLRLRQTMGVHPEEIKGTSTQARRSRFSHSDGIQPREARPLIDGDAELDAAIERLILQLESAASLDEVERILLKLGELPSVRLLAVVEKLLAHEESVVRGRALSVLTGHDHPGILQLAQQALRDPDEDVRLVAVELAEGVRSADAGEVLRTALRDGSQDVRQMALHAALTQGGGLRHKILLEAADAPQADLALTALSVMEGEMKKSLVPSFLKAIDHADEMVRETARDFVSLEFDQDFSNAEEALRWWREHQGSYDKDLVPLESESP
jgi:hypothetical protein